MAEYESTFSIPGIASSIDWGAMADKLLENARKPEKVWIATRDTLELKIGLLNEFSGALKSTRKTLSPLKLESTFRAKLAEFSSLSGGDAGGIVSAVVDADAAISQHEIEVIQKALNEVRFGARIKTTMGDAGLTAGGTFSINVGGRRGVIEVKTTDSLSAIAQKINAAKDVTINPATGSPWGESLGVTASVIDNRLVIKSTASGLGTTTDTTTLKRGIGPSDKLGFTLAKGIPSSGTVTISAGGVDYIEGTDFEAVSGTDEIVWLAAGSAPAAGTEYKVTYTVNSNAFSVDGTAEVLELLKLDDSTLADPEYRLEARDAVVKVDGLTLTRPSNTIDDLFEGVKLTIHGAGSVIMNITQDAEKAVTSIQEFVAAYNDTMDWINIRLSESTKSSPSTQGDQYKNEDFYKKFGLLHGNSLLWQSKSSLRQLMTNSVESKYSLKTGTPVLGTLAGEGLASDTYFDLKVGVRTARIAVTPADTLSTIASKINTSYEMTHDAQGRTYPIPMASAKVKDNQLVITSSPNRKFSLSAGDTVLDTLGLGTPFSLLSQIGITTEKTDYGKSGKLEFDTDKFIEALRKDPDGVAGIMNTVMEKMDGTIANLVDASQVEVGSTTAPKGRVASQISMWQSEISTINKRITDFERRLDIRARGLYDSFAQAEVRLAALQQQSSWLASVVSQMSGQAK